jgi:cell fate regulator YaaT (PSP1 superfamily)
MGCSSCSTSEGKVSEGCGNNGNCGTDGCNKLNVHDWLGNMVLPDGVKEFDIVEIRFKGSRKEFFRNRENLPVKEGDVVAVEGNPGHDIGVVSLTGELVRFQMNAKNVSPESAELKSLYRAARASDIEKWEAVQKQEVETMYKARTIALALELKMKLSDVEYQGDGKKATFYYTADERVDFRELIKKLAEEFHIRIEMRQIGMRQEASRLGGIGSCGRELCCSTWLTDFKKVSTSAARYQNLSLNQLKLAGQCGKLKCCLNYELDSYLDALKDIPGSNVKLESKNGMAVHKKTDIFKRLMWFSVASGSKTEKSGMDNWIVLSVDRVNEIIELNKKGEKPEEFGVYEDTFEVEAEPDYTDVVGQDSLTRLDNRKKKKKRKKKRRNPNADRDRNQNRNKGTKAK